MELKHAFYYHELRHCIFLLTEYNKERHESDINFYTPLCMALTPVHGHQGFRQYSYCDLPLGYTSHLDNAIQHVLRREDLSRRQIRTHLKTFTDDIGHTPAIFSPLFHRMSPITNLNHLKLLLNRDKVGVTEQQKQLVIALYTKIYAVGDPLESVILSPPL